jgi:hypothetical protein
MAEPGLCMAFYEAVGAIVALAGVTPLPPGISAVETEDWSLVVNNGREPAEHDGGEVGPWAVHASHKDFLVVAIFNPVGGAIGGGMSEGEFIDQMRAISGCSAEPQ